MKRIQIYAGVLIILTILFGIYLNRSYAHIYDKITNMPLPASNTQSVYVIGDSHKDQILYVALGDSLTAGVGVNQYKDSYPYQIAHRLAQDKKTVVLKPFASPGARTENITEDILQKVIESNPNIVTILLGVNDVHGGISKEEFIQNYKKILDRIISSTRAQVYVINIPYLGASSLILPPHSFYFKNKTEQFNTALEKLAQTYSSVSYIDLYRQTIHIEEESKYYASDLFHPSIVGYTLWASYIYENFDY